MDKLSIPITNLQTLACQALIDWENDKNPKINSEFLNDHHMTNLLRQGLKTTNPKAFYENPMKKALLTAKSMTKEENQSLVLRFKGILPQPALSTTTFYYHHQIARVKEVVSTEPGKTARVIVRFNSVYDLKITEVVMNIHLIILDPTQIVKFLMDALDKHSALEQLIFLDAKTNFWFERPNTKYGWRLSFHPDWQYFNKVSKPESLEWGPTLSIYLEAAFKKITSFVTNDLKKFNKEGCLEKAEFLEAESESNRKACPCGRDESEHLDTHDPFFIVCTDFDHLETN